MQFPTFNIKHLKFKNYNINNILQLQYHNASVARHARSIIIDDDDDKLMMIQRVDSSLVIVRQIYSMRSRRDQKLSMRRFRS